MIRSYYLSGAEMSRFSVFRKPGSELIDYIGEKLPRVMIRRCQFENPITSTSLSIRVFLSLIDYITSSIE